MASKRKPLPTEGPSSLVSTPSKKPKTITDLPQQMTRSHPPFTPFKRLLRLNQNSPMSRYRNEASLLFLRPYGSNETPVLTKLPKLYQKENVHGGVPVAVNGFDATHRHYCAHYAKLVRASEILREEIKYTMHYSGRLLDEVQASHGWVGQDGKGTWHGYDGRMKYFDAFLKARDRLAQLSRGVHKVIDAVDEPFEKFPQEFMDARACWGEEEEEDSDAEGGEWEDVNENMGDVEAAVPTSTQDNHPRVEVSDRHGDGRSITVNVNFRP